MGTSLGTAVEGVVAPAATCTSLGAVVEGEVASVTAGTLVDTATAGAWS